jgi:3-deoxy-D-manno-octulosonic-acid transferase
MFLLYSILLVIAFIFLLPRFIYDALTKGKYAANFRARLGRIPKFEPQGKKIIWLHCVSVGEAQAARPLASELLKSFPDYALVVSTTTITGQKIAHEVFQSEATAIFYFPFDFAFAVRRALDQVKPSLVLIMETELWPRFLRECKERKIPTAIVNGRLSEKSLRGYRLFKPFIKRVVNNLSLALMQTEADAKRMRSLGIAREKVHVTGNIKFDAQENTTEQQLSENFRSRFGFDGSHPLIVAASTHAPEESLVLEAFKRIRSSTRARLLIAPRHPERFNEVVSLISSSGLTWTRRADEPKETDVARDVILLDSIGELRAIYPLAQIVFVGGSLVPKGGHNVLEPAAAGVCVITGAHTSNFAAIVRDFVAANALDQLPRVPEDEAANELSVVLNRLLTDNEQRNRLAKNAKEVFEKNRGATRKTIEKIDSLIQ